MLSNFSVVFVLSSSDFVIISPLFTNCNPFFQFFSNFFEFFKKVAYSLTFSAQLFSKKPLLHINMPYYSYFIRLMQKIYSLFYYNKHSVFILTYLLFRLHIWLAFSIIYIRKSAYYKRNNLDKSFYSLYNSISK